MIKIFSAISIILAGLSLAIGYILAGFWPGAVLTGLAGLLWLLALRRGWERIFGLNIFIFMGLAALSTWLGVAGGWLLFSVVATLAAWDLGDFAKRFGATEPGPGYAAIQQRHGRRLVVIAGLGLLAGGIALSFELQLNLWGGILLGVLVIIGLSQAIARLRRESD